MAPASGGQLDVRRYRTPERTRRLPRYRAAAGAAARIRSGCSAAGSARHARFHAAHVCAGGRGTRRAWLLSVGGEPAAYLYCPIHDGTAIYEFVGHDPAFNDLSLGAVLQVEALRDLFAEPGVARFDFTEGDGQHKRQFATGGVDCFDLLLLRPSLPIARRLRRLRDSMVTMALAKAGVERLGLQNAAKKVRRAA